MATKRATAFIPMCRCWLRKRKQLNIGLEAETVKYYEFSGNIFIFGTNRARLIAYRARFSKEVIIEITLKITICHHMIIGSYKLICHLFRLREELYFVFKFQLLFSHMVAYKRRHVPTHMHTFAHPLERSFSLSSL